MQKNKIIGILIFSTLLSVFFILIAYFGILRYISMYVNGSEKYINDYKFLEKKFDDKIVISFTTTPSKIKKIMPMLNSILDQTIKVDMIYLIIPNDMKLDVPSNITNICNIFPSGKNYGYGTKIIPMLMKELDCDTTIIALDDNIIYGQDFIYTILEESKKNPDKVIIDSKNTTMLFKPNHFGCNIINRKMEKFDINWFVKNCKGIKKLDYYENYPILGF